MTTTDPTTEALLAEVRALRSRVDQLETQQEPAEERSGVVSRRALLGLAGAGVAGAAVLGTASPAAAAPSANDGEPLESGGTNIFQSEMTFQTDAITTANQDLLTLRNNDVTNTGATLEIDQNATTAGAKGIDLQHSGQGPAIDISNSGNAQGIQVSLNSGKSGIRVDQTGTGNSLNAVGDNSQTSSNINSSAAGSGSGVNVDHTGTGSGFSTSHSGGGAGLSVVQTGSGAGANIAKAGTGTAAIVSQTGTGAGLTSTISNGANTTAAVTATTNGSGSAVVATTTGAGDTVVATSTSGTAVDATATSGTAVDATTTSGTAVDANSTSGTAVDASSGGTATAVSSTQTGSGGNAVKATITGTGNASHALLATTSGSGHAVAGTVPASATNSVAATWGKHDGAGAGIGGVSADGYGGEFVGGLAALRLFPDPAVTGAGAPTAGTHQVGELFVDSEGDLYYCVVGGGPGSFQFTKLNDQDTGGGGGGAPSGPEGPTLLAAPERAFDSRSGRAPTSTDPGNKGTFASGETRTVGLAAATSLPTGAAGALVNVTVANTINSGFVTIYAADQTLTAAPTFSTLNWFQSDMQIANTTVTAIDATAKIKVFAANPCDVIIDVIGYYNA